jgi:hypothetical protein
VEREMSYDIYCYKPSSSTPNVNEAQAIIEKEESASVGNKEQAEIKEKIAKAILEYNPKLERFKFGFDKIAEIQKITVEEAKEKFSHIELNPPEDDDAIQIIIDNDNVFISTPYWYEGEDAQNVFTEIYSYLKIIKKEAGYFAYDPQTEIAFDPDEHEFDNLEGYEKIVRKLPEIAYNTYKENKKPWWKFR